MPRQAVLPALITERVWVTSQCMGDVAIRPGKPNETGNFKERIRSVPTSAFRVARALSGGKMMRTYADGTTKHVEWKTGEVRFNEPSKVPYSTRNVGKTDVHLYIVEFKETRQA